MTKRRAKQIALAIIATEDLASIVYAQINGANPRLNKLSAGDRQLIMVAADEVVQQLFNRTDDEVVDFVVGKGTK